MTLAVTSNASGRLAKASERQLLTPAMRLPRSPGYATFLAVVLILQMLALRLGEVRMHVTMDEAQAIRTQMAAAVSALPELTDRLQSTARKLAADVAEKRNFEFLGIGTGLAMAAFGAAKLQEAVGVHAVAVDLEEWAHLNYFIADPGDTVAVLVLPSHGPARDRASEIVRYAQTLGRPLITIGDPLPDTNGAVLEVVSHAPSFLAPFQLATPIALFAAELAIAVGAEHGRGNAGPWADSLGAATVQGGVINEELA